MPSSIRSNIKLFFYCPDGFSLINASLDAMPSRPFVAVPPGGRVSDYALGKFQSRSLGSNVVGSESYDSVIRFIQRYDRTSMLLRSRDLQPSSSSVHRRNITRPKLEDCFSVITVRSRNPRTNLSPGAVCLSDLVRFASRVANVDEFHCLMCRGNVEADGFPEVQNLWDLSLN